jgi:hypothetical protein
MVPVPALARVRGTVLGWVLALERVLGLGLLGRVR